MATVAKSTKSDSEVLAALSRRAQETCKRVRGRVIPAFKKTGIFPNLRSYIEAMGQAGIPRNTAKRDLLGMLTYGSVLEHEDGSITLDSWSSLEGAIRGAIRQLQENFEPVKRTKIATMVGRSEENEEFIRTYASVAYQLDMWKKPL